MGSPPYTQPPVHHSSFKDKRQCVSTSWVSGRDVPTQRCTRVPLWALVANKASGLKLEKDGLMDELLEGDMSEPLRKQKVLQVAEISMCRQCGQDFGRKQKVARNISASLDALSKRPLPRIENRSETPLAPSRPLRTAATDRRANHYETPMVHLRGGAYSNATPSPATPASSMTFGRQSPHNQSISSSSAESHPVFGKSIRDQGGFSSVNFFQNGSKGKGNASAWDNSPTPFISPGIWLRPAVDQTSAPVPKTLPTKSSREVQLEAQVARLEHQLRTKDDEIEVLRRQNSELEIERKTWKYKFRSLWRLTKAKLDVLDTATRGLRDDINGVEWSEGVESDGE